MDSQETKTIPVWMLTTAVVTILAGSMLWGYNVQAKNIHQTAFKAKFYIRASSSIHPIISAAQNKIIPIVFNDSVLLATVKSIKDTLVKVADNKPAATTFVLNTGSFDTIDADDDEPTPLNESIVMAYNVKKADTTPLNETAVMTYNAQRKVKNNKPAITDIATVSNNAVYPQTGWESFGKYINDKAVSADNKTGMVELEFTVTANGLPCDFKITQSLNNAADKAAIELIKNGPAWTNNTAGQPATVTVKVNFHALVKS